MTHVPAANDTHSMDQLNALFVRYRDGDVAALGQVFDRTAPQLLRLAMHLSRRSNDAEDLLQATFVLAMRKASTFDATRPLLPWLCGLLAGQARNLLRQGHRHQTEALPELACTDVDPSDAAARAELIRLLRGRVQTLTQEQRQVLLLQLQHGLSATEIAEVLDVPPGAVRMRLHRGLQTLRRLLPTTLAVWLSTRLPARGLAAVRVEVLRQAVGPAVAAGTATTFGGVFVMKKLLVLALVATVVTLLWLQIVARGITPAPAPDTTTAFANAAHESRASPADMPASVAFSLRTEAASNSRRRTVLVKSASSGLPLRDVAIRAWPGHGDQPPHVGETSIGRTDERGQVVFEDLAAGPWSCQPLAPFAQSASTTMVSTGTTEVELLLASRPLQGIVVDANGTPVADADIQLSSLGAYGAGRPDVQPDLGLRTVTRSGPDGTFTCERADDEMHVAATHDLAGTSCSHLTLPMADGAVRLVLQRRQGVIAGLVRDGNGQAIAQALVTCRPTTFQTARLADGQWLGNPLPVMTRSDDQGRFRCETLLDSMTLVWAQAPGTCLAVAYVQHARAGEPPVVLTLEPAMTIVGTVKRRDGSPVVGRKVYADLFEAAGGDPHFANTAADGSFTLPNLPTVDLVLRVARDPQSALLLQSVAAQAGTQSLALVLPELPCLSGQLLDSEGDALVGWRIHTTSLGTDQKDYGGYAVTDATGRFAVPDLASSSVRVDVYPSHGRQPVLSQAAVPTDKPLLLRVPNSAMPRGSVHGRIVDAMGQAMPDVTVTLHIEEQPVAIDTMATTANGTFQFGGLPAGGYELLAEVATPPTRRRLAFQIDANQSFGAGDLVLKAPATLHIELVHADGSAWRGMRPDVWLNHRGGNSALLQIDPSTNGYDAIVEPGELTLSTSEPDLMTRPIDVTVASAEQQSVRLAITIMRRLSLVFTADVAASDRGERTETRDRLHVTITAADGTEDKHVVRRSPRGDGNWTLEHRFAFGSFTVRAATDSGRRYAGAFEVRDDFAQPRRIDVPLQN